MTMTAFSPPKHRARLTWLGTRHRAVVAQAFRYLGALAVLATGVAHIEQYAVDDYSAVPTIGTLFLLNFIAAIVIAVALLAPLTRVAGRYTDAVRAAFAVGGIGLSVLSLAALFVSESSGLFGWMEHGYRMAIVVAIAVEVAGTIFLVAFLLTPHQALAGRPDQQRGGHRRLRADGVKRSNLTSGPALPHRRASGMSRK
jgi:hypothetical protein